MKFHSNLALAALLGLLTFTASPSFAAELPYTQTQFDSAMAAGKPLAVVFHADWCPTCRAQAPTLKALSQLPEFASTTVFIADFDAETALRKSLGVVKQSTIVVFSKGRERARSTGDTQTESLATLLRNAKG